MRADERATRMLRLLELVNEEVHPVPVSELAAAAAREFGVSEVTLRSDLAALCSLRGIQKLARGTYATTAGGGVTGMAGGSLFDTRLQHRSEGKIAIANAVAQVVADQKDLRVLLLDAGTTTYFVADRLSELRGLDLIVWTPSVAAAYRLAGARGVSVRLLGGEFQPDYAVVSGDETARALRALAGPEAEAAPLGDALQQFPGAHCVLDVNYVAADGRLYTDESKERLQKKLMADLAEDVTLVADHAKLFGRRLGLQAHEVYSLEQLHAKRTLRVVTDAGATPAQQEQLRALLSASFGEVEVVETGGAIVHSVRGAYLGE